MALPLSYNLRNVVVRWKTNLMAVGGIALVVTVFLVLTAIPGGFRRALAATGSERNAIVTQRGSTSELTSWISKETASPLMADDRVARDAAGRPLASPEVVVIANLIRRTDGQSTNVLLRGVTPAVYAVRVGIELVEGRRPRPGLDEVMVGERIHQRIQNCDLGKTVRIQRRNWQVVGIFRAGGSGFESEIWGDVEMFAQAFRRSGGFESVTLRLKDPPRAASWAKELQSDPRLPVDMQVERAYYAAQAGSAGTTLLALAYFVSVIMGAGAIFGAMNTMYGIVAARTREIATLRALGFGRSSILVTFLVESLLVALIGGVIGCLVAVPLTRFGWAQGGPNFAEFAFAFRLAPGNVLAALMFAMVMGLLGGLLPAIRAARLPIATALRES